MTASATTLLAPGRIPHEVSMENRAPARLHELDLLRFIAAAWVTLFHYAFRGPRGESARSELVYPWLEHGAAYGYLGMELFFMISGFVIPKSTEHGRLSRFVVSRVLRLYPVFWICCTLTFVALLAFDSPADPTVGRYLVNLTMLSGFLGVESLEGAYWSLFLEMRFYLLVALVLAFRQARRLEAFAFAWLVASIASELLPFTALRYLLIAEYSAFFIAGALLYFIHRDGFGPARAVALGVAWLYALFKSAANLAEMETFFGRDLSTPLVLSIVTLYFVALLLIATGRTGALGRRSWLALGALTYPLYLLHQEIGYLVFNAALPGTNPHLLLWGTLAAMLGLAWAVNEVAERWMVPALRPRVERAVALASDGRTWVFGTLRQAWRGAD